MKLNLLHPIKYIGRLKPLTGLFLTSALLGGVVLAIHLIPSSGTRPDPAPEISVKEDASKSGEVAGVSTDSHPGSPTPTPAKKAKAVNPTPTPAPAQSTTNNQPSSNNQSNNQSPQSNDTNTQPTNPSSTPPPDSEPCDDTFDYETGTDEEFYQLCPHLRPTSSPTPTPTPDNSPFEATLGIGSDTITITANKPLQKCQWVKWSQSPSIVVSNNGDGADLISGNTCTIDNNNSTYKFGAKVVSVYGEEKILGESPSNYW